MERGSFFLHGRGDLSSVCGSFALRRVIMWWDERRK